MATFYFSPIGNDSTGDGSQGNPWQTLSKTVSSSTSGDTLKADSDNGNHTWTTQTFSSSRTLTAYGSSSAVFDGAAATFDWATANAGTIVTISSINFQNAVGPTGASIALFRAGDGAGGVAKFIFSNCIFYNLSGGDSNGGIFASTTASGGTYAIQLTGCLVRDCAPTSGLLFFNYSNTLTTTLTNTTVVTNLVSGTASNFRLGIATITNCIFANLNGVAQNFEAGGLGATYSGGSNNLVYGYQNIPGAISSQAGYLTSDPLFVDFANANFNLQPISPCKFTGTPP